MSWNVLVTTRAMEEAGAAALARLRAAGCTIIFGPAGSLARFEGVDAVIAGAEPYSAGFLESPAAARLKLISRWGVGYDAIDVPAATRLGIVIAYTPGLTDGAVADYAFALLLALARHVPEGDRGMRAGKWLSRWGNDLAGGILGILGFGRIGRAVADRARGFGLRLLAHDPAPRPADLDAGVEFVSLDELLERSDFLSLHAALTPQSRGIIGRAQLRRMKPGARLINVARGPLVDEAALALALAEGWIAGAALDVFAEEPLALDSPLRAAPNLLLSPHQASSSLETGARVSRAAADAILELMDGRPPELTLNPAVYQSASLRAPITG